MIRRIQLLNYRCLRYVDISLDRFHVLAGANGSGKSTLFDALAFLADLVRDGLEAAIAKRTAEFRDLVWRRPAADPGFEIALELDIPESVRRALGPNHEFSRFRYEIAIKDAGEGAGINHERGILIPGATAGRSLQESLFPIPETLPSGAGRRGSKTVLGKTRTGNDSFNVENAEASGKSGKAWSVRVRLGPRRSTLANLPDSPDAFPAATDARHLLAERIQPVHLDSLGMRRASPPSAQSSTLHQNGCNLPWAAHWLRDADPTKFDDWLARLRAVLPQLDDVRVLIREQDRHAYLVLCDAGGAEVPCRMVSDGTLRLLALTLIAHLPGAGRTYLVEEPENGLGGTAIEAAYQSLSSIADAQVLVASHSPAFVGSAEPKQLLSFTQDNDGATQITAGE